MTPDNKDDIILVRNIDLGCTDDQTDIVKVSNRIKDNYDREMTVVEDVEETHNHADYFQIKFDGKPYRIKPGGSMLLPRFIAEHFAKYIADHLLQKKEVETGRQGLVTSRVERPKLLDQILKDMTGEMDMGDLNILDQETKAKILLSNPEVVKNNFDQPGAAQVDRDPTVDAGAVPNTALGNLSDEPLSWDEIVAASGEDFLKEDRIPVDQTSIIGGKSPDGKALPLPTRKQLIEMSYQQAIKITGKENKDQLIALLKKEM